MEPAKIDWKRIESVFVEDKLYENINAPKWVDFLSPEEENSVDDDQSWFCRADCNHPKTAEGFIKTTPTSKLSISADQAKSPPGKSNPRDAKLKRRGKIQSSVGSGGRSQFNEDGENQNLKPNSVMPPNHQATFMKAMIKSSTEKKKPINDIPQTNEAPRLKSTLSARNLLAGKDILGHIAEFCSELKKMATRAKERGKDEKVIEQESQEREKKVVVTVNEDTQNILREVDVKGRNRKPLLEMVKEKSKGMDEGVSKENMKRNERVYNTENFPVSPNFPNVKKKGDEHLLQIQTNPPSPQCFSVTHTANKATPSKSLKSRPKERRILQEVRQNKAMAKEEIEDKGSGFSIMDRREARALDVFWFLKPCTMSSQSGGTVA